MRKKRGICDAMCVCGCVTKKGNGPWETEKCAVVDGVMGWTSTRLGLGRDRTGPISQGKACPRCLLPGKRVCPYRG